MIVTARGINIATVDDITSSARPTLPYQQWTLDTAQSVVHVPGWLITNRRFFEGDHWQDQLGWVGPHPRPGDDDYVLGWLEIARCFTSENVIRALVERRTNGVVGREPMWKLTPREPTDEKGTPSDADKRLIGEATNALTPWWNDRHCHEQLWEWVAKLLSGYRSTLRTFVPPGLYLPGTLNGAPVRALRRAASLEDALNQLYVRALDPERATVYEQPETMQPAGVYLYANDQSAFGAQQRAEITWVDPATQATYMRSVGYGSAVGAVATLNLGGRLPMFEATHRPFITEQTRQLQRAYNLALTLLPHNLVTGGWLEMIVLSGRMPGYFKKDENNKPTNEWVPIPMPRGASKTQFIAPQEYGRLQDGSTQITDPSVAFRPPVDMSGVIESHESLYARMLDAANQVHILMSQDGSASGRSREVARAEFGATLRQPGARVQHAGRWMIETALAWAELLIGDPGRYTSRLRCEFTCRYDLGPLSTDEREANRADVEAGLLSDDEAMERGGVEDVVAMRTSILSSERGQLGLSVKQADAVQKWLDTGLSFRGALTAARIDDELADELLDEYEGQPDNVPEDGNPNAAANGANGNGAAGINGANGNRNGARRRTPAAAQ